VTCHVPASHSGVGGERVDDTALADGIVWGEGWRRLTGDGFSVADMLRGGEIL